ncbi:hypothetical protein ABTF74_19715, partial [Acinetobacter baumannii]
MQRHGRNGCSFGGMIGSQQGRGNGLGLRYGHRLSRHGGVLGGAVGRPAPHQTQLRPKQRAEPQQHDELRDIGP